MDLTGPRLLEPSRPARRTYNRYGNVVIPSTVCPLCKSKSFVLDGLTACCDFEVALEGNQMKVIVPPRFKRRKPSPERQQEILDLQEGKCLYCQNPFGSAVEVRGILRYLNVAWDHLVPYSYSANNRQENFVAACGVCNGLKSNMMFQSVEEVRDFIRRQWFRKRYRLL